MRPTAKTACQDLKRRMESSTYATNSFFRLQEFRNDQPAQRSYGLS
jgi:hypothetical protein